MPDPPGLDTEAFDHVDEDAVLLLVWTLLACDGPPRGTDAVEPVEAPFEATPLPDLRDVELRPDGLRNGDRAPDADLYVLGLPGDQVRLSRYVGPEGPAKAAIVAIMASWCAACQASLPTLKALEDAHGPDELIIVHLNVDSTLPGRERAMTRIREAGLRGPLLLAHPEVQRAWMGRGTAVPRFYFVNRSGEVLVQDRGFDAGVAELMPRQLAYTLNHPVR